MSEKELTVGELIEELKKFDSNKKVIMAPTNAPLEYTIASVEEFEGYIYLESNNE